MNYKPSDEDIWWILWRIEVLKKNPKRRTSHRDIWFGCYDVVLCEQDRIDARNIPKMQMEYVKENNLIYSTTEPTSPGSKYVEEYWHLTDDGKVFYQNYIKNNNIKMEVEVRVTCE